MEGNSMALDIQRFAEGGAEGTGAGESAAVAQPQDSGVNNPVAGENVDANAEGTDAVTLDSIFKKYPELKKEADKRTQKAVQGRVHQINKSMQPSNDIIDKLMVVHGVKSVDELSKKLDETLPEEFAIQNGLNNDMGREMMKLRLMEKRDSEMRAYYENQMQAERQLKQWEDEANEVRKVYPDIDLNKELENPDFRRLLNAPDPQYRMPMKQIYELIHHDELVEAAKKNTAAAYAKSTAQMAARPSENGLGNQSAVNSGKDVSKLTKKERAELAKRAQRGETITF